MSWPYSPPLARRSWESLPQPPRSGTSALGNTFYLSLLSRLNMALEEQGAMVFVAQRGVQSQGLARWRSACPVSDLWCFRREPMFPALCIGAAPIPRRR